MEIKLPDGRKATVLDEGTTALLIQLEDGRTVVWPKSKLPEPEGKETIKVVKVPAIDRLVELETDLMMLDRFGIKPTLEDEVGVKYSELYNGLIREALDEFNKKWGLT